MTQRFSDLIELVPSTSSAAEPLPIELPYTGKVIGSVPACTEPDVRLAVSRAREALEIWQRVPVQRRAEILLRLHDLVLDRQEDLMDLMQLETGKARRDALEEVLDVANTLRYYALNGPAWLGRQRRHGALPVLTHTYEIYRPHGVVGLICPWNYPFTLAISDAAPALLAGNAVVLKPAEHTSLTALMAALLFAEAGLPGGLLQVVTGRGDVTGGALLEYADAITFTGSTAVGRQIGRGAGERLVPFSLELGGKNPMIVLDDASLDRAVDGALRGCFSNTGQLCIATERLYVQDGIFDLFVPRFVSRTRALRLGARFDFEADVGSMISREQLEKTRRHVDDAVGRGARALTGGRSRPDIGPYFFEPTILTDVHAGMQAFDQETFGPVVSIYRFASDEDAVSSANASKYGLNASVWSSNPTRARRIAEAIHCGSVNINDAYAASWGSVDAPMGGMKQSGVGRRHGREGLLKNVEIQTIAAQRAMVAGAPIGGGVEAYRDATTAALRLLRRLRLSL